MPYRSRLGTLLKFAIPAYLVMNLAQVISQLAGKMLLQTPQDHPFQSGVLYFLAYLFLYFLLSLAGNRLAGQLYSPLKRATELFVKGLREIVSGKIEHRALILFALGAMVTSATGTAIQLALENGALEHANTLSSVLVMTILAPFFEEYYFRYCYYADVGEMPGRLFINTLVFVIWHDITPSLAGLTYALVVATLSHCFLSRYYLRGKNFAGAVMIHAAANTGTLLCIFTMH